MTVFSYFDGTDELEAYLALPAGDGPFPCVLIAPLTRIVSDVERVPVVWLLMDCDIAISL